MMKYYRQISLIMAGIFTAAGCFFLFAPNSVLSFFNSISLRIAMKEAPLTGANFYLVLASGYMYLVTLLAYLMYKFPENSLFPLLLANGKLASSFLSLFMFVTEQPFLIYLSNFIVDGIIGITVLFFYFRLKKKS